MSRVHANDVDLELESFGRSDDPLVLLIMGLGAQLVAWPTAFCEELAALGFCVVRFDNRDAGKSTHLIEAGIPDMAAISTAVAAGKQPDLPYHLDDMALDVKKRNDCQNRRYF